MYTKAAIEIGAEMLAEVAPEACAAARQAGSRLLESAGIKTVMLDGGGAAGTAADLMLPHVLTDAKGATMTFSGALEKTAAELPLAHERSVVSHLSGRVDWPALQTELDLAPPITTPAERTREILSNGSLADRWPLESQDFYRGKYRTQLNLGGDSREVHLRPLIDNGHGFSRRLPREEAVHQLHGMFAFETDSPINVTRMFAIDNKETPVWVQESIGNDFTQHARGTGSVETFLRNRLGEDPRFRSQLEETFLERLLVGDTDSKAANFTMREIAPRTFNAGNIDMNRALDDNLLPTWGPLTDLRSLVETEFAGKPISPNAIGKVDAFATKYNSAELQAVGVDKLRTDGFWRRLQWFRENRRFPNLA